MTAVIEGELARGTSSSCAPRRSPTPSRTTNWRRDPELATFDAARPYNGTLQRLPHHLQRRADLPQPLPPHDRRRRPRRQAHRQRHVLQRRLPPPRGRDRRHDRPARVLEPRLRHRPDAHLRPLHVRDRCRSTASTSRRWTGTYRAQRCFEKAGFQRYGTSRRGEYNFVLMEVRRPEPAPIRRQRPVVPQPAAVSR